MIQDRFIQKPRTTHSLGIGKQIVFALVITCSVLAVTEVGIRVWAYYFRTSYEQYNSTTGRLELVPNVRYSTENGMEFLINSKGFVGAEFDELPKEGVYRIISLGDSCTFTNGFWKIAYPFLFQGILNAGRSGMKYEVINAGVEGYNSTYALARLQEELLRYHPRLVTIYIGWNDLMKVNPFNVSSTGAYAFLAELFEGSYLVKAYKKLIFVYLRPLLFQPKIEVNEEDDKAFDEFVPMTYEKNLSSMVEILIQNHVQPVLMTLPTMVRPGMTLDEIKKGNVFFPYFANSYSVSRFLSLHRAYNRTIRRVGARHQMPIVDLDQIFNVRDKREFFWDTMHPSEKGNRLIAESVFQKMNELQL